MHDRAVRLTGAVISAAAIAAEIMTLLNIDLRIAQVRPCVEESVQHLPAPSHAHVHAFLVRCSVRYPQRITWRALAFSAETADATAAGFHLHFHEDFARKKTTIFLQGKGYDYEN
jgi:hypothetical protein